MILSDGKKAKRKTRLPILPLIIGFLLSACGSISVAREELGIPPSSIYFSFDDGPNASGDTTARLLDVLKKYEIRAIFVLLGKNAEKTPELVRRIREEGHYIASHGYSEQLAFTMNEEEFKNNLARAEAAIAEAAGKEMRLKLYRPHGGFYRAWQEEVIREAGYTMLAGNIRVYDAVLSEDDRDKTVKKVIAKVKKQEGGIILLHDGRDSYDHIERGLAKNPHGVFNRAWIPGAVEEIIKELLRLGYNLRNPAPPFF